MRLQGNLPFAWRKKTTGEIKIMMRQSVPEQELMMPDERGKDRNKDEAKTDFSGY